ncbi:anthrone oxygenase family protein [Vibrio penaeicida]|uniref:anthrone oxygenase family protein n=1 Tax=Vibrio penaeicida TaxID=104609 RepID=UPI000CEA2E8D|nr:anthrone oxygenase family protein [Vibrio penaeicida]
MFDSFLMVLEIVAFVTTSLLAGLYFIFNNTVMPVLKELKTPEVMVRINEVILNKAFLTVFFCSPVSSFLCILIFLYQAQAPTMPFFLLGSGLAISGFLITLFFNVPLNNRLKDSGTQLNQTWQHYLQKWGRWNAIRGYLSLVSITLMACHFVIQ